MSPVISRVTFSVVSIVITPPKGSRGPVLVYVPPCTVYVPPEVIFTFSPGEIVFAAAVPTAISLPLLKRATPSVKSSSTSTASSVSSSSWDSERSWISTSPLSSISSVSGSSAGSSAASSAASKITSSLSSPSSNSCISTSAAQMRDSGTTDVISTVPVRIAESSFRLFFTNSFFFILFLLPHFIFYGNIILYRTKLCNAHQKPKKCLFFLKKVLRRSQLTAVCIFVCYLFTKGFSSSRFSTPSV